MKQKLKLLMLIICTLSVWQTKAQTGLTCSDSRTITSTKFYKMYTDSSSEVWFSFVADSSHFVIESFSNMGNMANKVELYNGNCSALNLIEKDSVSLALEKELTIERNDFVIGNTYFVKVSFYSIVNYSNYVLSISKLLPADGVLRVTNLTTGASCILDDDGARPNDCSTLVACVGDIMQIEYFFDNGPAGLVPFNVPVPITITGGTPPLVNAIIPIGAPYFYTVPSAGNILITNVTVSSPPSTQPYTPFTIVAGSGNTIPSYTVSLSNPVCLGECVTFTPLNTNAISASFSSNDPYVGCPSGPFNTIPNTFIFSNAGINHVIYTLNAGTTCAQTFTFPVTVNTPSITVTNTINLCTLTGTFNASLSCNSNGGGTNFTWNVYAGSNTSTSPIFTNNNPFNNPLSYTFPSTGTYVVECIYYINNLPTTTTQTINVTAPPTPTITLTPAYTAPLCVGACRTHTANGALTYTWSTGTNTPTITLCPTVTTTYSVQGTSACGVVGTKTFVVTVYLPQGPISALANPNPICLGSSSSLQASGANSYTWTGGSIGIAQGNNIPITPTVTTTYTVIGSNGICANSTQSAVVTVTVNGSSIPTFSIVTPALNVCANGTGTNTVLFSTSITNTTGLTFAWNPTAVHTPTANIDISQSTIVMLTVTGACGATQTQTLAVNYVASTCCTNTSTALNSFTVNSTTINNQTFKVAANQTITINGTVTYNNCDFLMGTNSAIVELPIATLFLNNCKLYSCQGMWQGIVLLSSTNQPAKIYVRNSNIEDAYNAISSDYLLGGNSNLINVSTTSVLNKNYEDIVITYPSTVVNNANYPLKFMDSKMISQASTTSPGTNLKISNYYSPIIRNHSYAGLYTENAGIITFTYIGTSNNLVKNKDYGLIFKKTNADVWNVDFKDMIGVPLTFPNAYPLGVAIVSQNGAKFLHVKPIGTSTVPNCTFSNIGYGIIANKTPTVDVQYCDFNNPLQGTNNYGTYGIYTIDANSLLRMNYNTINKTYYGCSANFSVIPTPSTYSMSISNNTITAGTGSNFQSITVSASVTYPMMLGAMVVAANQITKARIGVYATNIHNGLRISGNTITLNNVGTHSPFIGIYLAGNNNGLMVDNNNIDGNQTGGAATYNLHCYGVRSDLSPNCFIQCNTITKTAIGIGYIGNNNSPSIGLFSNTLNYPIRRGLYLTNGAVIGTQGSTTQQSANLWIGAWLPSVFTTDPSQTYVGDGGTTSNAINGILYTHNNTSELPSDNRFFLPSINGNQYLTTISLFTTPANGTLTCAPTLTAGYRIGVTPTVNIAQRNVDYTNYITTVVTPTATELTGQEKWMLKQHMHKTIRQTGVGANATVANFYATQQADNVATYFAVDSLLSVGDITQAQSINNSAGVTNALEQNHNSFNNIYLNGVATASDYATLQTLANLCAYNNGNAVYQARALLDMINYSHTDYNDSCGAEKVGARLGKTTEEPINVQNITAKLYPNPNNGNFTLVYDLKEIPTASIVITDISGQIVYETKVDNMSSILAINTSELRSGLYFIQLHSNDRLLWTDKVMISK